MKRLFLGAMLACLGLCALVAVLRADDADKEKALHARLIGTWRAVSAKYNGQESDLPKTAVTYKHVTPTGFMWLSHEKDTGKVFRAAGGIYTLKGDTYTEKVQYGMGDDFEVIKRSSPAFTCRISGDKWFHTGKLSNGTTIEEVWERVKPEKSP